MKHLYLLLLAFIVFSCQSQKSPTTSLAVINARIWTGNATQPWAEAMIMNADTIAYVGSTDECKKKISANTEIVDAKGQMIVPGFIDSHVHFVSGGLRLNSIDLRNAQTKQEFINRIAAYVKNIPSGTWIVGGGWDHKNWGGELPEARWIDSITKNNPVFLSRLDGHMAFANSVAMGLAGVSASTKNIVGGEIVRDNKNNPTGIFSDNAKSLINKIVSEPTDAIKDKALENAMQFVASKGVTSVHNMGSWDDLAVFKRAHDKGNLKTRIYANVPLKTWSQLRDEVAKNGHGDKYLRIGGLKGYVDGSLGAHTAKMLQPFQDYAGDGLFITPVDSLYDYTLNADKNNLQVMVHAIGDKANQEQLNIYENVGKINGARDRRFRIEHAQHTSPTDALRFGSLGVIPSMQPYHTIDDGRWAEKVVGSKRIHEMYLYKDMLNSGAKIVFGSDWPVAPPTPLDGIYGAVTRRTLDEKNPTGWIPEQKITVEQALRAYTITAAYASFEEHIKGSLEVGKLADFVILQQDITNIPPETIRDVKIIATYVGGKKVY